MALHQRDSEIASINNFTLGLKHQRSFKAKMVKQIAEEFLPDPVDRKYYADQYRCCPPPLFILLITLVEVSKFLKSYCQDNSVKPKKKFDLSLVLSPTTPPQTALLPQTDPFRSIRYSSTVRIKELKSGDFSSTCFCTLGRLIDG